MYLRDTTIDGMARAFGLITPYDPRNLNPCSYDMTLGSEWMEINRIRRPNARGMQNSVRETPWMMPGDFLLGTTNETVRLPDDVAAQVLGKSSIGRMGLFIQNAGHIDPGFHGQITLELYNASKTRIDLSQIGRVCQLVFIPLDGAADCPYDGRYQGQTGPTPSRPEKAPDALEGYSPCVRDEVGE